MGKSSRPITPVAPATKMRMRPLYSRAARRPASQDDRRRILHVNVTAHPHAAWTAQQVVETVGPDVEIVRLIRDRDAAAASDIREAARRNCVRCNFSLNPSYGSCGEVFARRWRPARARRARHCTAACHALPARVASPGRELTGDLNALAEVDLVRCLSFERGVGDPLV